MQVTAFIMSWVRRVAAPVLGLDPHPLAFRDTLPDESRPTVPERLVRPADVVAAVATAHASGVSNSAKSRA